MDLKTWTLEYVKSRNAMRGTLKETVDNGEEITFMHSNKTHHFLVVEKLRVPEARDWYSVVCLNTEQNLRFLIDNWDAFLQDRLIVLFVHPEKGRFWQINVKLHNSVADPSTLVTGLQTIFSEVPEV